MGQWNYLKKIEKVITKVLDEVHVGKLGQDEVPDASWKGDLGVGKPGPVVRVGPPRVRMLERKSQTVVDGRDVDFRFRARQVWSQLKVNSLKLELLEQTWLMFIILFPELICLRLQCFSYHMTGWPVMELASDHLRLLNRAILTKPPTPTSLTDKLTIETRVDCLNHKETCEMWRFDCWRVDLRRVDMLP